MGAFIQSGLTTILPFMSELGEVLLHKCTQNLRKNGSSSLRNVNNSRSWDPLSDHMKFMRIEKMG